MYIHVHTYTYIYIYIHIYIYIYIAYVYIYMYGCLELRLYGKAVKMKLRAVNVAGAKQ